MVELFWLLLPVAACSGYLAASRQKTKNYWRLPGKSQANAFNQQYFKGLNLILNEETDKAVDVFIDLISVDQDTVETHMALGSLFRRNGEVERALRIHQNVIARPNLSQQQRLNGMLALGYDYLGAGVLDRAENIFKDISKQYPNNIMALKYLLDIYQRQLDWHSAIEVALLLQKNNSMNYSCNLAHYNCELSTQKIMQGNYEQALFYNKQALKYEPDNVRANLLFGNLCLKNNHVKKGIKVFFNLAENNIKHSELILPLLISSYNSNYSNQDYLLNFIDHLILQHPRIAVVKPVIDYLSVQKGYDYTRGVLAKTIDKSVNLRSLANLLHFITDDAFKCEKTFKLFYNSLIKLLAEQKNYNCHNCGFTCRELLWLCPSCKSWDTIQNTDFNE